jgi:hypothetical protein
MNVRDVRIIHTNLLTAVQAGRTADAYAWVRLLCWQLRVLTTPRNLTGTQEWQRVA